MSICQLRNCGLVDNTGRIAGFERLGAEQSSAVLRSALHVMRSMDIEEYVKSRRAMYAIPGRENYVNFPDDIVYVLLSKYLAAQTAAEQGHVAPCTDAQ
jgi:hypothetical protein